MNSSKVSVHRKTFTTLIDNLKTDETRTGLNRITMNFVYFNGETSHTFRVASDCGERNSEAFDPCRPVSVSADGIPSIDLSVDLSFGGHPAGDGRFGALRYSHPDFLQIR